MRTVRIGKSNYQVLVKTPQLYSRPTKGGMELVRVTEVLILGDNGGDSARGYAVCSPKDPYNGKVGVKLALQRALKNLKDDVKQVYPGKDGRRQWGRDLTTEEKAKFYALLR